VVAIHTGNCVDSDWIAGTVRGPLVLLEYEDVTKTWERDPKRKESNMTWNIWRQVPIFSSSGVSAHFHSLTFLNAFARFWKATTSFLMSVHPNGANRHQEEGFVWNLIFENFLMSVKTIQLSLKWNKLSSMRWTCTVLSSVSCPAVQYFSTYLIQCTIFGKKHYWT
jgi:hypothetical protein